MMDATHSEIAREIAFAASAFELLVTGHSPQSVTVVLSDQTLVITLHGALSQEERDLSKFPEGAAEIQATHQRLIATKAESFLKEIGRITGATVLRATSEVAVTTSAVVSMSAPGTKVHVFLLGGSAPVCTWSGNGQVEAA